MRVSFKKWLAIYAIGGVAASLFGCVLGVVVYLLKNADASLVILGTDYGTNLGAYTGAFAIIGLVIWGLVFIGYSLGLSRR
jgi:hypothetical protein